MVGAAEDRNGQRSRKITEFADELHRLRAGAGSPSFRKMASLSGCISHTTLAEAEKGLRFPSWETTQEFVKACGGDEADWRARWEGIKKDLAPGASAPTSEVTAPDVPAPGPDAHLVRRSRRSLPLAVGLVVLGVGVVITMMRIFSPSGSADDGELSPKDALVEGDHSRFIQDVTIPDGSQVQVREEFVKVWEIMNAGNVLWRGRYLQRQDLPVSPSTCQTAERVPIGDTLPNQRVMVSVRVTAPNEPTTCKIDWKMVDEQGRQFLPNSRPLYFLVHVVAP